MGDRRNVLITSAGRRTFLVEAFKGALAGRGRVIAADADPLAPALFLADEAQRLPRLRDVDYADRLLEVVSGSSVMAIVPTIDTELQQLAAIAPRLRTAGGIAVISAPAFVDLTVDKWQTIQAFSEHGVELPQSWLPERVAGSELPNNLVVKPRFGSASQGILHLTKSQLEAGLELTDNPIIQEELRGPELTVDVLFDMSGRLIHYVPRLRLKAIGGESVEGRTIGREELGPWLDNVLNLCGRLGARGPLTLQCFLEAEGPVLTEVNARFGGGFPLTHHAGGRYPEWLLEDLSGSKLEPRIGEYAVGATMTRHYQEIYPDRPAW